MNLYFLLTQAGVAGTLYALCFIHERCCKRLSAKHHAEIDAIKDFAVHIIIYSGLLIPAHG